jgi:hypothetical protein
MKKALLIVIISIASFIAVYEISQYISSDNNHISMNMRESSSYIYETDAESADECSSYEAYDEENKVCYFECSDENECTEIENSITAELDTWSDQEYHTPEKPIEEDGLEKSITEIYAVLQNEIIENISGKMTDEGLTIWKHIKEISPDSLSNQFIEEYVVFNDSKSDTLAFVDDIDGNGKWRVAVNQAGYEDSSVKERNLTIVHELSHIITLNKTQLKSSEQASCKTYYTDEGCAQSSSYLYQFVDTFWPLAERQAVANGKNPAYTKTRFVTEYATTNPEEDIAESFAYFVVEGTLPAQPQSIKEQKIAFFSQFPQALTIRETMRQGLISDIIRARKIKENNNIE